MKLNEHLEKLEGGCLSCRAKMCSVCPREKLKKKIRKELGIETHSFFEKIKKFFK